MSRLFAGTPFERPVTCETCERPLDECTCPRDAAGRVLSPSEQPLTIRREKRRKGKVVTTAAGFDPVASDLAAILKRLKSTCGAGGTITDAVVEVQGDHRERVAETLAAMGYPVRQSG